MHEPVCHVNLEAGCSLMAVSTTHDAMHAEQLPVLGYCASYEISHSFFLPFQGYEAAELGRTRGVSIDTCVDHCCSHYA